MFGFGGKENNTVYAPMKGECKDITECSDPVFGEKMMGDGVIIEPEEDTICSPCNGKLVMVYPTKHAFGVEMDDGKQVLVHIGVDTVNLQGKYFTKLKDQDQKVKAGTPVIRYDRKAITDAGYDPTVILIMTDQEEVEKYHLNEEVTTKDQVMKG